MSTIWTGLTHDAIFKAVEETLDKKLSNLCLKRNSYINRVYELEEHDSRQRFIVKFYRPGRWSQEQILEEHQFLFELEKNGVAVIAPLTIKGKTLFILEKFSFAIFPKKGGRSLDEFDQEGWETIGRILARTHLIGARHKESKRIIWQPSTATKHHLETLLINDYLPTDFKKGFQETAELFIKKAEPLFKNQESSLIHGDCHKGNLIHRPNEGIFVVDFDDCCLGPPVQDLWMLLPDTISNCEKELEWFRKGYETFKPFAKKSFELIPALQAMRIIHFAAWLSIQSSEPDFQNHFPEAGTNRYWNLLIKDLQEIVFERL
ncbi:MAG: serine/threonine protein kinase [bacterium]|nr:serine/threonine protein kinase [Candidatus Margulisiibacteriota bacterium]